MRPAHRAWIFLCVLPGCAGRGIFREPSSVPIIVDTVAIDGTLRPGATAIVDGQLAGTTPTTVRLGPGVHEISVAIGDERASGVFEIGSRRARVTLLPRLPMAEEAPGTLDPALVGEGVMQDKALLSMCYRLLLVQKGWARGRVDLSFQILGDGSVGWALAKYSELADAQTEECMAARLRRLTFAAPEGGPAIGEYSIEFKPDRRPGRGQREGR